MTDTRHTNAPRPMLNGYLFLAYIEHLRGNAASADELLAETEELSRAYGTQAYHHPGVVFYRTVIAIGRGDIDAAQRGLDQFAVSADTALASPAPDQALALARVRIAQGDYQAATPVLDYLYQLTGVSGQAWGLLNTRLLHALAAAATGAPEAALTLLTEALTAGGEEGVVRSFVDHGPPMMVLLREARRQGVQPTICERLLAAFS